jgi:hypothetical protein
MRGNVLRGGISLLDGDRVLGLGRQIVDDMNHANMCTDGDFALQPIMCGSVAADPAAAMEIHDRRKQIGRISWPNDPHRKGTGRTDWQYEVLYIRAWPAHWNRLERGQGGTRQLGGQALNWRFARDRVDELLCLRVNEGLASKVM